ncbi:LPXTG cell wall anchor domain-containing protein [Kitasatospora sp. NPDC087314]|uniref:LPXTG cell wall anchor domain-containing protein n=1 Tax=Kitasatospora sp. NPDC087314 TaxID=3364068 RepID=UPI003800FB18
MPPGPVTPESPSPATVSPSPSPGGRLPSTGATSLLPLGVVGGAALVGVGGVLVVVARRRRARHQ